MPVPLKTQIRQAVEAQLKLINGTGNYNYSYTVIENGKPEKFDTYGNGDFPLAYVVDSDEARYSFLGSDNNFSTGGDSQDLDGWILAVQAVIKRNDMDEDLTDEMDKLEYDIVYNISQNQQLGGIVDYIYAFQRDRQKNYGRKYAWLTVFFSVKYDFRPESGVI